MKIERMNKGSWGKVRAFFDVQTDEGFTIKGFKLIEGINGFFVSLPSQKGKDDEYFDTVYVAPEIREELNHVAIQTYGMQPEGNENFGFTEKSNTATPSMENQAPAENIGSTQESTLVDNPVKTEKVEDNNFSDDDIPF